MVIVVRILSILATYCACVVGNIKSMHCTNIERVLPCSTLRTAQDPAGVSLLAPLRHLSALRKESGWRKRRKKRQSPAAQAAVQLQCCMSSSDTEPDPQGYFCVWEEVLSRCVHLRQGSLGQWLCDTRLLCSMRCHFVLHEWRRTADVPAQESMPMRSAPKDEMRASAARWDISLILLLSSTTPFRKMVLGSGALAAPVHAVAEGSTRVPPSLNSFQFCLANFTEVPNSPLFLISSQDPCIIILVHSTCTSNTSMVDVPPLGG